MRPAGLAPGLILAVHAFGGVTGSTSAAADDRLAEKHPAVAFRIGEHTEVPQALTSSPDGKWTIAVKGNQAQLIATDGKRAVGQPWVHRDIGRTRRLQVVWAFSPDGKFVATALSGDTRGGGDTAANIRVWSLETRQLAAEVTPFRYNNLGYVRQMAFSQDSKTLLVRCEAISGK